MASGAVRELITKIKFVLDRASEQKVKSAVQGIKKQLEGIGKNQAKLKINADTTRATAAISSLKVQLAALNGKTATTYVQTKRKGASPAKEAGGKKGEGIADSGGTLMAAGAAMIAPLVFPIKEAMDFESAMADVRKVVDFDTPEQFKQMSRDIAELSTKIPMTKEQIAALVAAGGQANIARSELLDFATAAGKMGVAFDISAEEAGESMAQMKSAFGMTLPQIMSLSDAINHLGNNSSASSPKVLAVIKRVGSMGELAGFSATEVAALGAAITGIGVAPEVAATGIQNMSKALTGGYSVTKDTISAFDRIGLTFEQVKQNMQMDAKGTLIDVLERINKLGKADQIEVLTSIFKSESLESIAPLLNNLNLLKDTFGLVGDESKYAGSMEQEFNARNSTTANSVQLLKNELSKTVGEIGEDFLPTVNRLAKGLQKVTKRFSDFSKEHPQLVSGIMAGVAALGSLLAIFGGVGLAISGITSAFTALAPVFSTIGSAIGAVLGVGLAPVLAVLAAIASAIYFVGENWDLVVSWFTPALDSMMEGLESLKRAWEAIQPLIEALTPLIQFLATLIGGAIVGALSLMYRWWAYIFSQIAALIEWIAGKLGALGEIIQTIGAGLGGLIDKAAQFIGMKGLIGGVNTGITQRWADAAIAKATGTGNTITQQNEYTFTNPIQYPPVARTNTQLLSEFG